MLPWLSVTAVSTPATRSAWRYTALRRIQPERRHTTAGSEREPRYVPWCGLRRAIIYHWLHPAMVRTMEHSRSFVQGGMLLEEIAFGWLAIILVDYPGMSPLLGKSLGHFAHNDRYCTAGRALMKRSKRSPIGFLDTCTILISWEVLDRKAGAILQRTFFDATRARNPRSRDQVEPGERSASFRHSQTRRGAQDPSSLMWRLLSHLVDPELLPFRRHLPAHEYCPAVTKYYPRIWTRLSHPDASMAGVT